LGQFVTNVHAYLNEIIADIKKATLWKYTSYVDDVIFFRRVWAVGTSDDNIRLSVSVMPGIEQTKMEDQWAIYLIQARLQAQLRGR
jgi:hypothetical protein